VMVCSDNGASAEGGAHGSFNEHAWALGQEDDLDVSLARIDELGGPRAYGHYAWGWAWAGNTPFRLWKRYTWLGGTRTPLVVHWPNGVPARGEVRSQFAHAVDVAPTVLDAAGVAAPRVVDGVDQQPMHGASLVPSFADPDAPARVTQYFEMLGSRSIVDGQWKATTDHISQGVPDEAALVGSRDFETDHWALFDLAADFAEALDVSRQHPEVVRRLVALWWSEAGRYDVLPLDDSLTARIVALVPSPHPPRYRWSFRPGMAVTEDGAPLLIGGFHLTAELAPVAAAPVEGVLCAQGDWTNGWAFVVLDHRPVFLWSRFGVPYRIAADTPLAEGSTELRVEYTREDAGGGPLRLLVDGVCVAEARLPRDLPFRWQIGGARFHVGFDRGLPVSDDYRPPFAFTGTLRRIVIELPYLAHLEQRVDPEASLLTD